MKAKTIAQNLKDAPGFLAVPFETNRFFSGNSKLVLFAGDQACLTDMGDYGNINELRKAVEWYVEQLNGKVTWNE